MHRVYVHEGNVWTLASAYATRGPLPTDPEQYVVMETERPPSSQPVCTLLEDGRHLCDVGPMHAHNPDARYVPEGEERMRRQAGLESL